MGLAGAAAPGESSSGNPPADGPISQVSWQPPEPAQAYTSRQYVPVTSAAKENPSGYELLSASLSDRRMNAWPNRRAETVFFSDGISYAQLDGAWYEKFCDPLRQILDKGGRSTFMISPLHEYLVPRDSPSLFIQPCIDMVKIRNYLLPKPGEASSVLLREHADCCTYLAQRGLPATLMDMHTVRTYTRMIEGIAGLYGRYERERKAATPWLFRDLPG